MSRSQPWPFKQSNPSKTSCVFGGLSAMSLAQQTLAVLLSANANKCCSPSSKARVV
jgi:hypothetical protein